MRSPFFSKVNRVDLDSKWVGCIPVEDDTCGILLAFDENEWKSVWGNGISDSSMGCLNESEEDLWGDEDWIRWLLWIGFVNNWFGLEIQALIYHNFSYTRFRARLCAWEMVYKKSTHARC